MIESMLNSKISIRGMELKNRIGFPPMLTMSADSNGNPTDTHMTWYGNIAKGGVGFIMVEAVGAYPTSKSPTCLYLGEDKNIPAFSRLADTIHSYGAKAGVQIAENAFTMGLAAVAVKAEALAPSPIPASQGVLSLMSAMPQAKVDKKINVHALTVEEIDKVENAFAAAAGRVKKAGFDCVEIHAAHSTLHSAFMSPYFNKRTDEYGGDWDKRLRLTIETVQKVRDTVGDFPILVRISGDELFSEFRPGVVGITIDDTVKHIAPRLEKAGVDCIDVSMGLVNVNPQGITIPLYYPEGGFIHLPEAIKKVVNIPVIGVGMIYNVKSAENYVNAKKADIIYMGRQLICDPDTPLKYFEGRPEDIRMCIGCLQGPCRMCATNFEAGKDIPITKAEESKKVLIVGGGVAGMEAARIAALRGHNVSLYEKTDKLGGLVLLASKEHGKDKFKNLTDYLETQIKKLGVKIELGKEVTSELVDELKPDVVISATGSSPSLPEIAVGKPNVISQDEAILNSKKVGDRVVVWGLEVGAETAIALAEDGKKVTLIGKGKQIAPQLMMAIGRRYWVLEMINKLGIDVHFKAIVEDITDEGVVITDKKGENRQVILADTIISAGGRKANQELFEALKDKVTVHKIGDCVNPRDIPSAIRGANNLVRGL